MTGEMRLDIVKALARLLARSVYTFGVKRSLTAITPTDRSCAINFIADWHRKA